MYSRGQTLQPRVVCRAVPCSSNAMPINGCPSVVCFCSVSVSGDWDVFPSRCSVWVTEPKGRTWKGL